MSLFIESLKDIAPPPLFAESRQYQFERNYICRVIQFEVFLSWVSAYLVLRVLARYHRDFVGFYYTKILRRSKISRSEFMRLYKFLHTKLPYFNSLSDTGKAEFVERMWRFRRAKRFTASGNFKLTDNMINYVSAAAIRLTFGLEDFMIRSHPDIVIHAEHFYLPGSRRKMKGAASRTGQIHLSWPDLKEGFDIPDDRYNLGLHEMAHALKMTTLGGKTFDYRFKIYYSGWHKSVKDEFLKLKHGNEHFLRSYGGANMHEFFAVCIEHFLKSRKG